MTADGPRTDPSGEGRDLGTMVFGGLLIVVALGFVAVTLLLSATARTGLNAMMLMLGLFAGVVVGGSGAYLIYRGAGRSSGEARTSRERA